MKLRQYVPVLIRLGKKIIKDKKREIIESDLATLQDKCRDIKLVESLLQYKTRPEYNFIFSGGYEVKSFLEWSRATLKDNFACSMWEFQDSNLR